MNRQRSIIIAAACIAFTLQSCSRTEKQIGQQVAITDLSSEPHPTGDTSWTRYWREALVYPKAAKEKKLEGRVVVKFTVDQKGNPVNPTIATSTDPLFSQAALDNMKRMPKWVPAEKFGHKIAVEMYQPFLYTLGFNNTTTVATVSADTCVKTISAFEGCLPSTYMKMMRDGKNTAPIAQKIELEMKAINKANDDIVKAHKEIAEAHEEMARLQALESKTSH